MKALHKLWLKAQLALVQLRIKLVKKKLGVAMQERDRLRAAIDQLEFWKTESMRLQEIALGHLKTKQFKKARKTLEQAKVAQNRFLQELKKVTNPNPELVASAELLEEVQTQVIAHLDSTNPK